MYKQQTQLLLKSEHLRRSEFHRNLIVQVRRAVEIENIFHIKTELNVSDFGIRPDKVKVEDVMVGRRWHSGEEWMRWPMNKAVLQVCIGPAMELRISDTEKEDYKEGHFKEKSYGCQD